MLLSAKLLTREHFSIFVELRLTQGAERCDACNVDLDGPQDIVGMLCSDQVQPSPDVHIRSGGIYIYIYTFGTLGRSSSMHIVRTTHMLCETVSQSTTHPMITSIDGSINQQ